MTLRNSFSHRRFPTRNYDVPGSANSQDDRIVWGRTLVQHNERLNKVFLKIRESRLKLN